jgi:DNA polymerase III alpha subunit
VTGASARAPLPGNPIGLDALLAEAAARAVEARIAELQRPLVVTQRTVEGVVGLPRRDFLRLARAGAFASTRERRLVLARTADVIAYVERHLAQHVHHDAPANDATEASVLARVGARRIAD